MVKEYIQCDRCWNEVPKEKSVEIPHKKTKLRFCLPCAEETGNLPKR